MFPMTRNGSDADQRDFPVFIQYGAHSCHFCISEILATWESINSSKGRGKDFAWIMGGGKVEDHNDIHKLTYWPLQFMPHCSLLNIVGKRAGLILPRLNVHNLSFCLHMGASPKEPKDVCDPLKNPWVTLQQVASHLSGRASKYLYYCTPFLDFVCSYRNVGIRA